MKKKDLELLKQFIQQNALQCVHPPEGQLKYSYVTPSYCVIPGDDDLSGTPQRSLIGHYLQMYDWDACFFSQAAHRIGLPDIPESVVRNFLHLKDKDGYIPRTVSPHHIWDQGDLCKPFLAQTLLHHWSRAHAPAQHAPTILTDLDHYLCYFQNHRLSSLGLYCWRNVLESGVDDNLALLVPREAHRSETEQATHFPDSRVLAVDLNSYLIAEFRAFSKLADRLQSNELSHRYRQLADELAERMETQLWNEELGLYCNFDVDSGQPITIRSWTGLVPALLEVARPERVQQVIHKNILDEKHFWRPSGLASMAASEPLYNQARRGLYGRALVSNWQGPMWVLPNVLAVRCLAKHGYQDQALELASRVTCTMLDGLKQHDTLFENYHAETGEPLWAPQFMSWNILALELIEMLG